MISSAQKISDPKSVDSASGAPLDDCRALLLSLPVYDQNAATAVAAQIDASLMSRSSQGRFRDWTLWLAGWMATAPTTHLKLGVHIFAGNNGWIRSQDATRLLSDLRVRMGALSSGGAAASAIAGALGAGLHLYDLATDTPSANATREDGMSEIACARAIAFGLECVRHDSDVLIVKAMGTGLREVASALALKLLGGSPADWLAGCELDSGDDFGYSQSVVQQIEQRLNRGKPDPLELVRRSGCREIAAVIGAVIAARAQRMPVIVEGFAATVALAILQAQQAGSVDHCRVASSDGTPGHDALCRQLQYEPVLDLKMCGIDGVPGLSAGQLLRTAVIAHGEAANRAAFDDLLSNRPNLAH
jgi:nicotinate-nucleotide--dimethylbenzimidazole phosphoribosyltransferase